MLYSDLKGRKLVDTSSADTVGKVDGFLLDPETQSIAGLEFKKTDGGNTVAWSVITAVGEDAVTIPNTHVIIEPEGRLVELASKRGVVLKKRVLTDAGEDLGEVRDVDLDPSSGSVVALVLGSKKEPVQVAGTRILGVGSYAVVVRAE